MIYWICGFICGSVSTLLLYSLFVGKRIQEEQDKAFKVLDEIQKLTEYLCHKAFQMPQDEDVDV